MKTKKNKIKLFELHEENKLHKVFGELISSKTDCVSEEKALNCKRLGVCDPANIFIAEALTVRAKMFLRRYVDVDRTLDDKDFANLKYNRKGISKSKFSIHYLKIVFDFFGLEIDSENWQAVYVSVNKDYPITVENGDFKFILAPRVDNK